MFSLPCILWRLLNWQTGFFFLFTCCFWLLGLITTNNFSLNIQNVVAAACDARSVVEQAEKEKLVDAISSAVIEILDLQVISNILMLNY